MEHGVESLYQNGRPSKANARHKSAGQFEALFLKA